MTPSDTIWDTTTDVFQPSLLHHLAPMGVGTPYIESLTSYMKRLAQNHYLRVVDLIAFCAAQSEHDVTTSTTQKLARIDGNTQTASQWAPLIHDLTRHPDVPYLSLFYWRTLFNPYRTLRQHHAWCEQCFGAWSVSNQPLYEPLLWRLKIVTHCSVHGCLLTEQCPHCHNQITSLSNNAVIGFCPKCVGWLGVAPLQAPELSQTDADIQTLETLLALAPQVRCFSPEMVARSLESVKRECKLSYTKLEPMLGISTTSMMDVIKRQRPLIALQPFLRLAQLPESHLFEKLKGNTIPEVVAKPADNEETKPLLRQDIPGYLNALVDSTERLPALKDIARHCGYATATVLRGQFPQQYERLRQRVRTEQRLLLEAVLSDDEIVTVNDLARRAGYGKDELRRYFPKICKQISAAYRQRHHDRCQQYLESILAGNTYPSMTVIARHLGISVGQLKHRFPDELLQITNKRHSQDEQVRQMAQQALDSALQDDQPIPESLHQIAASLKVSTKHLKKHFPEQAQQVLERYRRYKEACVRRNCDLIRQTVFDLHERGIYPSVDRIHATISSWMIHGGVYRDTYQKALEICGYLPDR
jgi:AraC-like DNA-binding protein